jgi:hypothetical protein
VKLPRSSKHCGTDVAAIGFTAPPSAFGRPRGLSSASCPTGLLRTRSDHFHELGLSFRDPSGNRLFSPGPCGFRLPTAALLRDRPVRGSSHGLPCPFSVRGKVSRTRGRTFQVQRHPLSAFLTPSGVSSSLSRATIFRWLTLIGFPLQSFLPPRTGRALVALARPPRRFPTEGAEPVARPCCLLPLRPRGVSVPGKRYHTCRPGEGSEEGPCSPGRSSVSVVNPGAGLGFPFGEAIRSWSFSVRSSKLANCRTSSVFPPAAWRLGP